MGPFGVIRWAKKNNIEDYEKIEFDDEFEKWARWAVAIGAGIFAIGLFLTKYYFGGW